MLQALISSRNLAEALSFWATTLGIFVALVAGIGAYWKHVRQRRDAEWDRAREVYSKFLELAMNNPEFIPGFWSSRDKNDLILENKYYWFMGQHLWACEDIITSHPEDGAWRACLITNLSWHADYLSSEQFKIEFTSYYDPVQKLILDAVVEGGKRMKSED